VAAPGAAPAASPRRGSRGARPLARRCTSPPRSSRSEEHTSELQSQSNLVCRLLLEKKKKKTNKQTIDIIAEDTISCKLSRPHKHLSSSASLTPYIYLTYSPKYRDMPVISTHGIHSS